jgi:GAF domain-containing protein
MLIVNLFNTTGARAPQIALGPRIGIEPQGPARGHSSGPAPYRVLIVGGTALAGRGVLTHDLAVTGALARSLGRLLSHGVDTDSVIGSPMDLDRADEAIRTARLEHYDALVLIIDPDGAARQAADFDGRLQHLLDEAASRMPATSAVTVAVAPFLHSTSISAREHQTFVDSVRSAAQPRAQFVELAAAQTPSVAGLYGSWADQIATATAPSLREPALWSDPVDVFDDDVRTIALSQLGGSVEDRDPALQRIVSLASTAYGSRMAAMSVIDRTMTHYAVVSDGLPYSDPRNESICDQVLATYGGVIVGDAGTDPRFAHLEPVETGMVRFYAGYRINDPDGVPVGVLCVHDPEARSVLSQDIALLRDLALAAERRLRELVRERSLVASS